MRDPSPAAFSCAVLTGLLGLAQVFRPWDPKSPVRKWKSCAGATRRNLLLLAFYFAAYFVAILVLFFEVTSHLAPHLLFELSWLSGLSIEAAFLQRTFSIPSDIRVSHILRILVLLIAATAGLLQVVGFAISFSDAGIGRYVAFAGGRLFHVSAAAVFIFPLKYKIARHRKLIYFTLTYTFAAVGGFLFIPISNGDTFLLANCILGCVVNFILLALAQIESGSVSARLRLESDSVNTKKATAGNAGRGSLRIEVEQAVTISIERYGLPTPPPSPVPAELFISPSDSTPSRPDSKTCKTSCCSVLDITVSETCVVHARVLAKWETKNGRVLRLITMDWEKISRDWGLQLEEHIGKIVYDIAERLSSSKSGAGMVLLAERDLCDVGLSPEDCQSLVDGCDLYISGQVGLADIPWMFSLS